MSNKTYQRAIAESSSLFVHMHQEAGQYELIGRHGLHALILAELDEVLHYPIMLSYCPFRPSRGTQPVRIIRVLF